MKIVLKRVAMKDAYTIGKLFIDDKFFCHTIEDTVRDYNRDGDLNDEGETKVYGETAIPFGTYKMVINYSPRFKRELPRLLDVPHFSGILIHPGNTADDSHGCILLGYNDQIGRVSNSRMWFDKFFKLLKDSGLNEFKITVE